MKLPAGHVSGIGVVKATGFGGFGEKILKQQGWAKGQGLGIGGQGIQDALKVAQKFDAYGVGQQKRQREVEKDWWEQHYNSCVQHLNEEEGSSSEDSSDDEAGNTPRLNRDGTKASGSRQELQLAAQLAEGRWGRFGGRKGKLARIREQEAALLASMKGSEAPKEAVCPAKKPKLSGEQQAGSQAGQVTANTSENLKGAVATHELADASQPKLKPSATKRKKSRQEHQNSLIESAKLASEPEARGLVPSIHKGRIIEIDATDQSHESQPFVSGAKPGWWGEKLFSSAGCMDGLHKPKKEKEDTAFTEDTQANIYNEAQSTKTAGKQGLGVGKGGSMKVVQWSGKRTTFSEATEMRDEPVVEPIVAVPLPSAAGYSGQRLPRPKLKKLSRKILRQEGSHSLSLKKLCKKLISHLHASDASLSVKELQSLLQSQVDKDPKLQIEGKSIRLLA